MINDNYEPVKLVGNGTTVDFSFNWNVLASSYIRVYLEEIATGTQTSQTLGSDFTLVFDETGGTVTFFTAPTSVYNVIIAREIALSQEKPYTTSKGFDGKTMEGSLDKLTGAVQDVNSYAKRAVVLPLGSPLYGTLELPTPIAGKALLWNDDADGLTNSTDEFDDIVTDATAQAVIATTQAGLATTAAGNAATYETNAQGYASTASTAKDDALLAQTAAESARDLAQGYADAANVAKMEWQGTWSAGSYNEHDVVEHNGSSWIATTITTEEPSISATDWDLVALKGTDGTGDMTNPMTTAGDIIVGGAGGNPERLAIGTAGQVAKSNGTTLVYDYPIPIASAGGTVDAITATYTTGVVSLSDGMQVRVVAAGANTGSVTFSPNSLTAHSVTKFGGTALSAGDVKGAGHELLMSYNLDNTRWELLNPASTSGLVLQQVRYQTGAVATGSTTIPNDNTIPQQTGEGNQFMSLAITPKSATSTLVIDVCVMITPSVACQMVGALFRDSGENAIACMDMVMTSGGNPSVMNFKHVETSGSTSATTFKVKCGGNNAGTWTFNGISGSPYYGGTLASSIIITEYAS